MNSANKPEAYGLPREPLADSVADACRVSTLCKSQIYILIRAGKLEASKLGGRTVIPAHSLRAIKLTPTGRNA
ncbi:MAG: helix-turn-helix domain-containing protein [Novosphingobium sp.]